MMMKKSANIVPVVVMDLGAHIALQRNIDMAVVIISAVGVVQLVLGQDAHTVQAKSMKNKKVVIASPYE
jgi:hypothetical protein